MARGQYPGSYPFHLAGRLFIHFVNFDSDWNIDTKPNRCKSDYEYYSKKPYLIQWNPSIQQIKSQIIDIQNSSLKQPGKCFR